MDSLKPFVYGGFASIVAEFGTFPIDTAKTRLQIQTSKQAKFGGMTDCIYKIYKFEGLKALYSGILPAVLRQSVYGTLKFGTYYSLKNLIITNMPNNQNEDVENLYMNVVCATVAGAFSSALANPTDVLKVRMQIHGKGTNKMGLFNCFKDIYRNEGMRGLYRGVFQTSQRASVIAAVELPVYDYCKHYLLDTIGDLPSNHFISSFVASLLAAIASCPIDVIRTRLMNQKKLIRSIETVPVQSTVYFSNSFQCLSSILKNEGFSALYKGFVPSFLRMGPWNVIFFLTYEQLKRL